MAGEPDLKVGDSGEWVTYLRQLLEAAGTAMTPGDDQFDDALAGLVVAFQLGHGLTADGIVGAATWNALSEASGSPAGGEAEGEQAEAPIEEPIDMEIVQDCSFDLHDIIVWPGNPAYRVAAWSQSLHHEMHNPEGEVIGQGDHPFPSAEIGPGEYAIVEIQELSRTPGDGYKLVLQVNPSIGGSTTELALNVDESRNWQKA